MELYLFKSFNNYFNRIVKRYDTIDEYITNYDYCVFTNVNFNYKDGINTTQVVYWEEDWQPDYFIVVDFGKITSRWFISQSDKSRGKQFILTLKRDVVADNYNSIINAPTFIQKATLKETDPFIFNPEGMSFNQIKKSETLINNGKNIAWLLVYADKKTDYKPTSENEGHPCIVSTGVDYGAINVTDSWRGYDFETSSNKGKIINKTDLLYGFRVSQEKDQLGPYEHQFNATNGNVVASYYDHNVSHIVGLKYNGGTIACSTSIGSQIGIQIDSFYNKTVSFLKDKSDSFIDLEEYNELKANYDGKLIKDSNNKYFIVHFIDALTISSYGYGLTSGELFETFEGACSSPKFSGEANSDSFYIGSAGARQFYIELEEQPQYDAVFHMELFEETNDTKDAPYSIFAIPISSTGTCTVKLSALSTFKLTNQMSLNIAQSIIKEWGSAIYDVQIIPYCQLDQYVDEDEFDVSTLTASVSEENLGDYSLVQDIQSNNFGIILKLNSSKYTTFINQTITTSESLKISNETETYRLISPNYNGSFELSIAKNGGSINGFNVSCDFKPYQPCIIVQPQFNFIYGSNFSDARGLILAGDFSIPSITSQWSEYQIQNKNFENAFNRQIEYMDFQNQQANVQQIFGALVGTGQGAAIGGMVGGVPGAIIGGVASGIGGVVDTAMQLQMQRENKQYAIDQYNYQLGNIKARPYSINKIGCLNNNFKYFPFVEYYSATEEEKEALQLKLEYDGMTVMRIGYIKDYLQNDYSFIKGEIIRIEDLSDDVHMFNEIYNELRKGVYIV